MVRRWILSHGSVLLRAAGDDDGGEIRRPGGGQNETWLAMHGEKGVDHIVTLCASCASHLKHNYPKLFADDPAMLNTVQRNSPTR